MNATTTLFANYQLQPHAYDESWNEHGRIQPHWQPYLDALQKQDLSQVRQDIQRLLQDNGVTYNVHGDPHRQPRPWRLDVVPLIISEADWAAIEAGIQQRAHLLNLILADLYGPQTLIRQGLIPPELIFGHDGYLRPCINIPDSGKLTLYAADLGRGPDNRMWVLGDRTQAPSGAGYALENRTVMTRVLSQMFNDGKIRRLSSFFRQLQNSINQLIPNNDAAQTVVLTPGPLNETYFEHAYLAAYLGYSLVQGSDLTVRDGQVWLKTIEGLRPVSVILRRVDDSFCDPLELRSYSQLGVPGLLETVRRQKTAVANPLGSGVLENPGLMPFMPNLARHFLSEDLLLPTAATWWCGQPQELDHVLQNLPNLVIKRIARTAQSKTIFGNLLSQQELADLRDRIRQRPYLYVGQEQVSFSTAPSLVDDHFEARPTILRSFAVSSPDGYVVMPGGLTRSAAEPNNFIVSSRADGTSRDTWVLTSQPQNHISLWLQPDQRQRVLEHSFSLPSRAAENLFWVGRYAERAEATARLLRAILNQFLQANSEQDENRQASHRQMLRALTELTLTYPGFVGDGSKKRLRTPRPELRAVALSSEQNGSIHNNIQALMRAASSVRDLWSNDTWRLLQNMDESWSLLYRRSETITLYQLWDGLNQLITQLMALAGLNYESVTHGSNWLMLDSGRRLERAQMTMGLIKAMVSQVWPPQVEALLLEQLLITTENIITYRRRYRSYLQLHTVLEQLLLDQTNPRAVIYQLDTLQAHLEKLPRQMKSFRLSDEERLVLQARTQLRLSEIADLLLADGETAVYPHLHTLLSDLHTLLSEAAQMITHYYFSHVQTAHPLIAAPPNPEADSLL